MCLLFVNYLENRTRQSRKLKLLWLLNLGWYPSMIIAGSILHRKEVEGFLLPLLLLTLAGGAFLGRWLMRSLKKSVLPKAVREEFFRSGALDRKSVV